MNETVHVKCEELIPGGILVFSRLCVDDISSFEEYVKLIFHHKGSKKK